MTNRKDPAKTVRATGLTVSALCLVGFTSSCKTRDFGAAEIEAVANNPRTFDANSQRGRQKITHGSPGGVTETCILPNHFPGVKYPKDDEKDEAELCGLNFYKAPSSSDPGEAVALCPKLSSTFPGVEAYELDGKDKGTYETQLCKTRGDRPTSRIAKFKQSFSCSYTGSILGYYHLSRILGEADNVPVAVIRTMDVREHAKIADRGIAWSDSNPNDNLNQQLWRGVRNLDASGGSKASYFSSDKQVYGALSVNPAGEEKYNPINDNVGDNSRPHFLAEAEVAAVFQAGGIGSSVKRDFASAAQKIQQMKDISDLVIMDYAFQQQDRYGNIHYQNYWMWLDDKGEVEKKRQKNGAAAPVPGAVLVKRMLLKDNDCGNRPESQNPFKIEDVKRLKHLSMKTYKRLRYLASKIPTGEVEKFFVQEALVSLPSQNDNPSALDKDATGNNLMTRISLAASALKANCKAGTLLLDLSIEDHLASKNTPAALQGRCDEVFQPEEDNVADTTSPRTPSTQAPPAVLGKVIAKNDTWLKQKAVDSSTLRPEEKCLLKANSSIGYKKKTTQGVHTLLEVDIRPSEGVCPKELFVNNQNQISIFTDHFTFVEPR